MKALIINCSPVRDGATAEIVKTVAEELSHRHETRCICIDDYRYSFCTGCRSCHETGKCIMEDDVDVIMDEFEKADIIIAVSPSYWADVPGQFKAFIDRCTPWSNTHQPHAAFSSGKKGYAIVLRTGQNMKECERLIQTIEHFYGHLEIEACGSLGLTSVEYKENVGSRKPEIREFCSRI
ncbi:MAG: flavodoxin family protein [Erysipelotrichaceae bacterium]|nr:flavodoxin family protein [Erysipelotrichaceae bacterium]